MNVILCFCAKSKRLDKLFLKRSAGRGGHWGGSSDIRSIGSSWQSGVRIQLEVTRIHLTAKKIRSAKKKVDLDSTFKNSMRIKIIEYLSRY